MHSQPQSIHSQSQSGQGSKIPSKENIPNSMSNMNNNIPSNPKIPTAQSISQRQQTQENNMSNPSHKSLANHENPDGLFKALSSQQTQSSKSQKDPTVQNEQ